MNERIKLARQTRGLTQKQLGDMIGVSKNLVSMLESGNRALTERTINDICRVLSINEDWIKTGEGDMFLEKSKDQEIFDLISSIMSKTPESTKLKMVSIILNYPEDEWEMLYNLAKKFISE